MSRNLRPVYEMWGPPSNVFLETNKAGAVVEAFANAAGVACSEIDAEEMLIVTLYDPARFLDYLERTTEIELLDAVQRFLVDPLDTEEQADLGYLVQSLKDLVTRWQAFYEASNKDYLEIKIDY